MPRRMLVGAALCAVSVLGFVGLGVALYHAGVAADQGEPWAGIWALWALVAVCTATLAAGILALTGAPWRDAER